MAARALSYESHDLGTPNSVLIWLIGSRLPPTTLSCSLIMKVLRKVLTMDVVPLEKTTLDTVDAIAELKDERTPRGKLILYP